MNTIGANNFNLNNTAAVNYAQAQKSDNTAVAVPADSFSASADSSSALSQNVTVLKHSAIVNAALPNSLSPTDKPDDVKAAGDRKGFGLITDKLGKFFSNAKNIAVSCITGTPHVSAAAAAAMDAIYKMENRDELSLDELVELANKIAADINPRKKELDVQDGSAFSAVLNKFGYDALPQVLTSAQFDQEAKKQPVFYRGVEPSEEISAGQMADDFKHGKLFSGGSKGGCMYGRGTYASYDTRVSDRYKGANGVTMEMLLSSDAKVAKYENPEKYYSRYESTAVQDEFERFRYHHKMSQKAKNLFSDAGSFAVLKGYDAYYCCKSKDDELGYKYIVVLNRQKVMIKE